MKVYNNNQLYKSPAGDQLWNSGRQNWIFGHIGDQEGAISDPESCLELQRPNKTTVYLLNSIFLHDSHTWQICIVSKHVKFETYFSGAISAYYEKIYFSALL